MEMKNDRISKINENHKKKYNCAQAVACVYAPLFGVEDETVTFRAMEGFGGGMAVKGTCGAVSAMAYIAGLANSDGNLDAPASKQKTYEVLRAMVKEFTEKNKSIICSEIKGLETGVVLRSCPGCMEDAGEIIEKYIMGETNEQQTL